MRQAERFKSLAGKAKPTPMVYTEGSGWQSSGAPGRSIIGALLRRGRQIPPDVNTIDVLSLDDAIEQVLAEGGALKVPRTAVPGVGYVAYCTDSQGILFGLMQGDTSAR